LAAETQRRRDRMGEDGRREGWNRRHRDTERQRAGESDRTFQPPAGIVSPGGSAPFMCGSYCPLWVLQSRYGAGNPTARPFAPGTRNAPVRAGGYYALHGYFVAGGQPAGTVCPSWVAAALRGTVCPAGIAAARRGIVCPSWVFQSNGAPTAMASPTPGTALAPARRPVGTRLATPLPNLGAGLLYERGQLPRPPSPRPGCARHPSPHPRRGGSAVARTTDRCDGSWRCVRRDTAPSNRPPLCLCASVPPVSSLSFVPALVALRPCVSAAIPRDPAWLVVCAAACYHCEWWGSPRAGCPRRMIAWG